MTSGHNTAQQAASRRALLSAWLVRRLSPDAIGWLDQQSAAIQSGDRPLQLGIAIGLAPRKVGKADLDLASAEALDGEAVRPGLDAKGWSVDQAARILLVLACYRGDDTAFAAQLGRILSTAEIGEQIALLKGLALFPAPERHLAHATEGVRSAMQPIFEAVAHCNPYPREQFSAAQWNQMVVKTLFIGSRLSPIQGLDARRNPDLARMLVDYADERRAAGRPISPELWRCVAPFAGMAELTRLAAILRDGSDAERSGAALALSECPLPAARETLASIPDLASAIEQGRLTWTTAA